MGADEAVGSFRILDPSVQWVGRGAYLAALCATGFLERVQFGLRFLEARTWWASNGRDVLNAAAFAALTGSAWLIGFSPPIALVLGATVLVLVNALQSALRRRRSATWMSMGLAVALGLPVLIAPADVDGALRAALRMLF
jgi:hypothetical protein